jgi:hypothetical protein
VWGFCLSETRTWRVAVDHKYLFSEELLKELAAVLNPDLTAFVVLHT